MRLLLIINPRSGRGRALPLAEHFEAELLRLGHDVESALIDGDQTGRRRDSRLAQLDQYDAAVVFGGDGTVHHLLPALAAARTPLYHVPMGTENLFARQFRMDRRPGTLAHALQSLRVMDVDLGEANGRLFAIMCSVGPDASIVRRLAATRRGAIRRRSYLAPIMSEIVRPSLTPLSVSVDGRTVATERSGLLLIGNSPMYALGLNPARHADMTDGRLDVVFLPAAGSFAMAGWACRAALGSILGCRGVIFERASAITVRAPGEIPYQLDGDEGGLAGGRAGDLTIRAHPSALRVLAPDLKQEGPRAQVRGARVGR